MKNLPFLIAPIALLLLLIRIEYNYHNAYKHFDLCKKYQNKCDSFQSKEMWDSSQVYLEKSAKEFKIGAYYTTAF